MTLGSFGRPRGEELAYPSQLIYVSPVRWSSFAQRPHHFVRWYHQRFGARVVWLEPYATRLPRFADLRRNDQPPFDSAGAPDWIQLIGVPALPVEPLPGVCRLNQPLWQNILCELEAISRQGDTLVVIGKPSRFALAVLDRLGHCLSLYDAMDDFPWFYSGLSRWSMRRHENQLLQRVQRLWYSSSWLGRRLAGKVSQAELVMNGLDVETLPPVVGRPVRLGKRVLGYVGTIAKWFDWQWLIALARSCTGDMVRLVGPLHVPVPAALPDNVELLPACDHNAAIEMMQDFDIGLIPFERTMLTRSVDPIKYYEYRALGLPVISTGFGEMHRHAADDPGLVIAETGDELLGALTYASNYRDTDVQISSFRARYDWRCRFDAARVV